MKNIYRYLLTLFYLLSVGVFINSNTSLACRCYYYPLNVEYQVRDAIFSGVVKNIQYDNIMGTLSVEFQVQQLWKGTYSQQITVVTNIYIPSCGFPFKMDTTYLVYANLVDETLTTNSCTRTKSMSWASEDLTFLSTVGVKEYPGKSIIPLKLDLFPNYPNPANPTTVIRYSVPHSMDVILALYNSIGQKVAELFSGYVNSGYKEFNLDCSRLSSGVYMTLLKTDIGMKSGKIVVIK